MKGDYTGFDSHMEDGQDRRMNKAARMSRLDDLIRKLGAVKKVLSEDQ